MTSLLGALGNAVVTRLQDNAPVPYTSEENAPTGFLAMLRGNSGPDRRRLTEMYGAVSTLHSVVSLHAEAVSQVDWKLYRKAPSGRKEDRREVTDHQALRLWNQANDFIPGPELREGVQQHIELVGEGWLVVERGPGVYRSIPIGLWPVRPDQIEPVTDPKKFCVGYLYTGPNGEKIPLELDEVLRLKMPNPGDPHRGMGAVQTLARTIDSIRYGEEWNRNFFVNSAQPGGIIEVPEFMEDHEFKQLARRWNQQHRGVNKAHRVAILEKGKWVSTNFSTKDMQFTELSVLGRDKILEAYRTHKHMLGISDDVNLANAKAADYTFAKRGSIPRLVRWRAMANGPYLKLFGTTGQGLEFDFCSPVPEDEELENATRSSQATSAKALVEAGYHPEDVATTTGLPPMRFVGTNTGTGEADAPVAV